MTVARWVTPGGRGREVAGMVRAGMRKDTRQTHYDAKYRVTCRDWRGMPEMARLGRGQ